MCVCVGGGRGVGRWERERLNAFKVDGLNMDVIVSMMDFFGFYTPCKEVNGGNGRLFGLKLQCASFVHCVFSSGVFLVGTRHEKLDCNTDVSRRQN